MTGNRSPKASEEPTATANAARQRRKRKWDQPADSLISAGLSIPGAFTLGMGGIVGITLPGVVPVSSALLTNPLPATSAISSALFNPPSIPQNAAAIVQKLNQPKILDELIAREIVINDAEPTVRYKLTKRQTQEEIQKWTGAVVITRGKYQPPNGLRDNDKPLYLHISAGAHLKDTAERIKAVDRAACMIEEILKQGQNSLTASTPFQSAIGDGKVNQLLNACLFLGFDTDPSLNIAARIRGPNDQYINHIMNETGASVLLRGQGSGDLENSHLEEAQQPLHLYLSSNNPKSLEDARILAENLLDTICAECGASRISTCKVYTVPPPHQLLAEVQTSGEVLDTNASSVNGAQMSSISNSCPPGAVSKSVGLPSYEIPRYSHPSVRAGTCYSGYGGIYPQATPLQQVALALRKAPASASSIPVSTTSPVSTFPKTSPSSKSSETDKRPPQKRKFQELPVTLKGPTTPCQNLQQGSEFLKSGLEDSPLRNVSTMPPPKKLVQPESELMPPPPPPRTMPPPPKFPSTKSPPQVETRNPESMKSSCEPVSDTLLKLVEYGEEDDYIDPSDEDLSESNRTQKPSAKPFWAV